MRKLIGKGSFTKCYQISETEVEVVSICPSKECYALFSQDNLFAPVIEKIDYLATGYSVYHMPKYPRITAPKKQLNEKAYAIYKALRYISNFNMDYYEFVQIVEELALTAEVKKEIIDLCSDVCNAIDPQDVRFEISPRNITTNDRGDLIMLDCFFSCKLLASTRSRK